MKLKQIDSEIRTIQLSYEEEKPLSEYETQIISRYVEIHKIHAGYEKKLMEYEEKMEVTERFTESIRIKLDIIKKQLNDLLAYSGSLVTGEVKTRMLEAKTDKYNADVKAFHLELCEANDDWISLCNGLNAFFDGWESTFEDQLSEFSDFTDKLYENYEDYMLDTNSFWDDHEQFKVCLQKTSARVDVVYDRLQKGLENWESLATAANLFFDFVNTQENFDNLNNRDSLN